MPWTAQLANLNELRRCVRDLVALSALPAGWQNYDMRQIGSSIVAALTSMLDADFVFISLPGKGNQHVTELTRGNLTLFADATSGPDLHVVTAPIGFGSDAISAAGSRRDAFPTRTEKLLLNIGANQAAIAFQQWLGDAEKRRFTAVVQRTTDFVGIAR